MVPPRPLALMLLLALGAVACQVDRASASPEPERAVTGDVHSDHAFLEPGKPDESGELHRADPADPALVDRLAVEGVLEIEASPVESDLIGVGSYGQLGRPTEAGFSAGFGRRRTEAEIEVRFGPATSTGKLDKDFAQGIIAAHRTEIQFCWARKKAVGVSGGKLSLTIEVAADDTVSKVTSTPASSDLDAVARCLEAKAAKWRFIKDVEGSVSLEIEFSTQS